MNETEMVEKLKELAREDMELGLIAELVYVYGRSLDEVLCLKWDDIDFQDESIAFNIHRQGQESQIRCPLQGNERSVLNKVGLMETLQEYKGEDAGKYLFLESSDSSVQSKKRTFQKFLQRHDLTSQGLRKMRGLHLYSKGVSVETIQRVYLHKERSTTMNYLGLKKEALGVDIDVALSIF